MTKSWMPTKNDFEDFFKPSLFGECISNSDEDDSMSKTLAMLVLLYGLPFSYLVPHETYLGENETRFFYLDPNWIKALLDGAMSLGRNAEIDYKHDAAYLEEVYSRTLRGADRIRPELQDKPAREDTGTWGEIACTGFLMRSPLVRGWRGLEFKAYGENGAELPALRIETLSDEILIGLYRDVIKRLDVLEPPEGLHYGFNRNEEPAKHTKTLRRLEDGCLIGTTVTVAEKTNRVIDFATTAKSIGTALKCNATSAHIALEMIQNPHMINFERK